MPSTTGNIAAVETEASSQLNSRLAVTRIASKPEETTRNSDASFVNAFPRSPLASGNMKTTGPDIAAMAGRISRHQSRHHMR
jgi:hypothetical protein